MLFGISLLVFIFVALAPGDPVSAYLPPDFGNNPELRRILTERLGLDQPLPIRYVRWLGETVQGNLGYAAISGRPVNDVVWNALQASAVLLGSALMIGIAAGVPLGMLSALRQYSKLDFAMTTLAFLGISTPSFLLGIGALYVFGLELNIFPIGGMSTIGQDLGIVDFLVHLALPVMVLAVGHIAIITRYTRSAMLDVIHTQYMTTAESKGLPPRIVVLRHGFRNALISIVTIIGLFLPELVGGAVITETVFNWPGMGSTMVTAVTGRDFPVIMGISVVVAVAVLAANLLTDIAYAFVDPRIRY
jgi:peptide/nickel transport system permease protein